MRASGIRRYQSATGSAPPVRHGGFRPLDAEEVVFDAPGGGRTGPRRGGQPPQALVKSEPAFGEAVVSDWPGPAGCGRSSDDGS